ncbi:hypothetical protein BU24DRAFT_463663 [Aaosphaeria arxii CBS 175.79]|uniref:C2H2-type domain-containing protein n=1 Tax=Aaosphaeria arxii CBS 175.79 TaxID=1450172 RepID=A0A6A5XRJ5_9PLEO|nr:uncharacterized protein BU24DRAFT_463663 [Aaosphaeria arxii CBS 175.79]KAF2014924.1 hypothetical protein BU24DRAFT_463663 [Aaosphaeria arxii CBS 175.79]
MVPLMDDVERSYNLIWHRTGFVGSDTNLAFLLFLHEPCFDASPPDYLSFSTNQAVHIAKWTEDVSGATSYGPEFLFSSSEGDMHTAEAFELKHETASVYSMDSAYQSQRGSARRGAEGYSQDNRSHVNNQFLGSEIFSPTLSSDTLGAFHEQQPDMSHMQLPSAATDLDAGDNSFAFANYTTGQDFSQFTATSIPRFTPSSGVDMSFQWGMTESNTYSNPFAFSYPKSSNSLETTLYSSQDPSDLMFNVPAPPQRQLNKPRIDTSVRPAALRNTSSYNSTPVSRRASANESGFGAYVMSPTSAINISSAAALEYEQTPTVDTRADKAEIASTSFSAQSIPDEDDELLSPSDAAEAQNMEEEQGKVARSHPLYQAQPDESGKYHCPHEGTTTCNHKPTPLKCNYDKYVDSHLKPFRCNKKVCVGVQFSSTACLLRHEREAHGMHGHGSRPHLCHFADCERSVMGNGFPRRYNLFDHMKRVHDYTGPTTEPSPPVQPAPGNRKGMSRKRKSTADEGTEKRQKVAKPTPQQQAQMRRRQLQDDFLNKKQNIIDILSNLGGPNDLGNDIQLTKEVVDLHEISAEYKKSLG